VAYSRAAKAFASASVSSMSFYFAMAAALSADFLIASDTLWACASCATFSNAASA